MKQILFSDVSYLHIIAFTWALYYTSDGCLIRRPYQGQIKTSGVFDPKYLEFSLNSPKTSVSPKKSLLFPWGLLMRYPLWAHCSTPLLSHWILRSSPRFFRRQLCNLWL